jgi:hypothetical protein
MSDPLVDGVVRSQKDSSWPDINRDRRRDRSHPDGHRVRHSRGPGEDRQGDGVRQRISTRRDDGGATVAGAADRRNARIPDRVYK